MVIFKRNLHILSVSLHTDAHPNELNRNGRFADASATDDGQFVLDDWRPECGRVLLLPRTRHCVMYPVGALEMLNGESQSIVLALGVSYTQLPAGDAQSNTHAHRYHARQEVTNNPPAALRNLFVPTHRQNKLCAEHAHANHSGEGMGSRVTNRE